MKRCVKAHVAYKKAQRACDKCGKLVEAAVKAGESVGRMQVQRVVLSCARALHQLKQRHEALGLEAWGRRMELNTAIWVLESVFGPVPWAQYGEARVFFQEERRCATMRARGDLTANTIPDQPSV